VAAGFGTASDQSGGFALARYNADGSPDTGSGTCPFIVTNFTSDIDSAFAVTLQPDGKVVAAGVAGARNGPAGPEGGEFALARYGISANPTPTPTPNPTPTPCSETTNYTVDS